MALTLWSENVPQFTQVPLSRRMKMQFACLHFNDPIILMYCGVLHSYKQIEFLSIGVLHSFL